MYDFLLDFTDDSYKISTREEKYFAYMNGNKNPPAPAEGLENLKLIQINLYRLFLHHVFLIDHLQFLLQLGQTRVPLSPYQNLHG